MTEAARLGLTYCVTEMGLRRRLRLRRTKSRLVLLLPRRERRAKRLRREVAGPGRQNGECALRRGRGRAAGEAPGKILGPAPCLIFGEEEEGKGCCTSADKPIKCRQGESAVGSPPTTPSGASALRGHVSTKNSSIYVL